MYIYRRCPHAVTLLHLMSLCMNIWIYINIYIYIHTSPELSPKEKSPKNKDVQTIILAILVNWIYSDAVCYFDEDVVSYSCQRNTFWNVSLQLKSFRKSFWKGKIVFTLFQINRKMVDTIYFDSFRGVASPP